MRIKIMSVLLALLFLLNVGAYASFYDVYPQTGVGKAVEQLSKLGIISGFSDGTFRPDDTLTRGQFAKIAVHMLGEEAQAYSRSSNSVFSDVPKTHWASGYVNYIAEKGIINGYPDGTFGVEDKITYAQALTILIRLLGYSGEDVGYRWPDGYITKAQALEITEGMTFGTYENVTRGNAAYVVYRTLLAEKNPSAKISLIALSEVEDVIVYADSSVDISLADGAISTTKGSYKLAEGFAVDSALFGRTGSLYLDEEGEVIDFVVQNETERAIVVSSAAASADQKKVEITFSEGNITKTESFSAGASAYYDGKSATLGNIVPELEAGREVRLIYSSNGNFARMYLKESSLKGPQTITTGYSQIYSFFNISNSGTLKVIRDGKNAKLSDIDYYDVVYYMEGNNTLYAYTDKISGTYEEAYPLKANVTSVKIAGREYKLSNQRAINKMNTSDGAFEIGERVTLLLGRNGEVVDVVDLATIGSLDLAVLTKCYKEVSDKVENQGQTIHYVDVVVSDGTQVTYKVNDDYSDYIGNVVKVSYENEIAKLSAVKHSSIYGAFDLSAKTLGGHSLSENCVILEMTKYTKKEATIKKITLGDIRTKTLTKEHVIHAETEGEMKDITFLFVTDITKSESEFGVVIDKTDNRYTVLIGTQTKTIQTAIGLGNGSVLEIEENENGQIASPLKDVGRGSAVEGYSNGKIRVDGTNYDVSDYVKVYGGRYASELESMSVSELVNNENVQKVTLYSDRALNQGGIIRAIVVKTKK